MPPLVVVARSKSATEKERMMSTYRVRIEGVTGLIMHNDNIGYCEKVKAWLSSPMNKDKTNKGDDRTPAWTWLGYMYADNGLVCIPADNLQTMLREGGSKVPTGKKGATFKRLTQSGMVVNETSWSLFVDGETINASELFELLREEEDYQKHVAAAKERGFILFEKRARIGQAKHVRVRPRFDRWAAEGTITVMDDQIITQDSLAMIVGCAGDSCGLGDWRPSSQKPGPYGRFTATLSKVK